MPKKTLILKKKKIDRPTIHLSAWYLELALLFCQPEHPTSTYLPTEYLRARHAVWAVSPGADITFLGPVLGDHVIERRPARTGVKLRRRTGTNSTTVSVLVLDKSLAERICIQFLIYIWDVYVAYKFKKLPEVGYHK